MSSTPLVNDQKSPKVEIQDSAITNNNSNDNDDDNNNNNLIYYNSNNDSELASLKNTPNSSHSGFTPKKTKHHDQAYEDSFSHNIHHDRHLLRHPTKGGPIARFLDKFSLSPHFRRFCIVGLVIWFLLLIPAAWIPVERVACPATMTEPPVPSDAPSPAPLTMTMMNADRSSSSTSSSHNNNSNLKRSAIISESFDDNVSNSLVFCRESADPDPLRWTCGVALSVSLVCLLLSTIFSELAARNVCNYQKHAQLLGVLPLVIFRTLSISGIIVAYSIQLWFLIHLKRPDCPATDHPCALYRLTETSLTLGLICAVYVVIFMIGCFLLTFGVEKQLSPGLVKRILLTGGRSGADLPVDDDDAEPSSPHFVALQEEMCEKCCCCSSCSKEESCGCCFSLASCLDFIRLKYHFWYHVDSESCCSGSNDDENTNNTNQETNKTPFKQTLTNAFIHALFGSISPCLGYFLLISTILLMEANASDSVWALTPQPDSWFSCEDLFPAVQQLPTIVSGEDTALYRLTSHNNAEVLICSNLSDFDPVIKKLPGFLRSPNFVSADYPSCSYHDVEARCQGPYCKEAYHANPAPFGVFFSYKFSPIARSPCGFSVVPRPGIISNCTQNNIIRLSGLGESLIGKSFLLPPFCLAIILRFSAPVFAAVFLFIRFAWYRRADQQEEFRKHYGKHKKHYLEAFACDTIGANFIVAAFDPCRFTELPDPPRYRMAMVSVQVCEFLIWIFRVEPCWRWYALLFVCAQGIVMMKSIYNLYRDEIMIAKNELAIESRRRQGEEVISETD